MLGNVVDLIRTERAFRRVWFAQMVSEVGDWFQLVAIVSLFPTKEDGGLLVAGIIITRYVAAALVSPLGGVLADRFPRGRVMILADLARALVALCFLWVRSPADAPLLLVLCFAIEGLSVVFEPARGAAIPQLVPFDKLYAANTLSGATWSAMLAVGAMIGGMVSAVLGRPTAFVLNAASFIISAALVASARVPPLPREEGDDGEKASSPRGGYRDGLRFLAKSPAQASLLLYKPGILLASGGMYVLVSVFADRVFSGDPALVTGWLYGARGAGALVGPFIAARVLGSAGGALRRGLVLGMPFAMILFVAFSAAPTVPLAAVALLSANMSTSTIWVSSAQLVQTTVPNRVLGRVLSVELTLVTLALAGGAALAAGLLRYAHMPPRQVALTVALSLAVPSLLVYLANARYGAELDEISRSRSRSS
ncbi:MAG: MFS transporter [Myxococcales bacterium]|nr:MFS transporter [Myxococcales bacterium]